MTRPAIARPVAGSQHHSAAALAVHNEVVAGLSAAHPFVSPKYLYDALGSRLFEAITDLPEYYPTRTERGIFSRHGIEMARAAGAGSTFIDLGAGNCEKARSLFEVFAPKQYVAIDISAEFLESALQGLRRQFPELQMLGLGMDFSAGLALPGPVEVERRLFFYPGSSIGNFTPLAALALLSDIRRHCGSGGGLLIGFDLVKDVTVLEAAYDDALGVTSAFNLNLLNHLNTAVGTDFNVRDWKHRACFNPMQSRIEMHLDAVRDVDVRWPGGGRSFCQGQNIHTESSHKYTQAGIRSLLAQAGFRDVRAWTDEREWFAVCHAVV